MARRAVALTGDTLDASLKMKCDTSGALYAIYWLKLAGEYVVGGSYTEDHEAIKEYVEMCAGLKLATGGMVDSVSTTGVPAFIDSAGTCPKFSRLDECKKCGIRSVCIEAFEMGVLEYGTSASWTEAPSCPEIPDAQIRDAIEGSSASYAILWVEKDGRFVGSDFVTPWRKRVLRNLRGDNDNFASVSIKRFEDSSSVAKVAKEKEELYIDDAADSNKFERADLAQEFGIKSVRLLPCDAGVFEYGVTKDALLTGDLLRAMLKMSCQISGASYSIYWVEVDGQFVVAADYVTNAAREQLQKQRGDSETFVSKCEKRKVPAKSIIGVAYSSGEPAFIPDALTCDLFTRKDIGAEFGIKSVCLLPAAGGVLEYGSTVAWKEPPPSPMLPKAEMKTAFTDFGAVFVMYWVQRGGNWVVSADYTCPARVLALKNKRDDDKNFSICCRELTLGADSAIANVASSGVPLNIDNAQDYPSFMREDLAKEFNLKKVRIVPCDGGVLEYGLASTKAFGEDSLQTLGLGVGGALAFCSYVYWSRGLVDATAWFSCYVIEYSLSIDNLFVFIIIFKYFKVPRPLQNDILNYGIYGAIIFRFVFVYLGAIVLQQFNFLILGFAAILVYASYSGLTSEEEEEDEDEDLEDNFVVQNLRKVLDVSPNFDGNKFFTEVDGRNMATPLLICLLTIEISDIVFATDSVPAVLGTTSDQFIAYTSNVFAIYGLRTLFFLLDEAIASFSYLEKAVNFVLGFIGLKIFLDYFEILQVDVVASLAIVLGTLAAGVILSLQEMQEQAEKRGSMAA